MGSWISQIDSVSQGIRHYDGSEEGRHVRRYELRHYGTGKGGGEIRQLRHHGVGKGGERSEKLVIGSQGEFRRLEAGGRSPAVFRRQHSLAVKRTCAQL